MFYNLGAGLTIIICMYELSKMQHKDGLSVLELSEQGLLQFTIAIVISVIVQIGNIEYDIE